MADNEITSTDTDSEAGDLVDSSALEAAVDNALGAGIGFGGPVGSGGDECECMRACNLAFCVAS